MATAPMTKTCPRDGNAAVMQTAQTLQYQDAAGTPIVSPKAAVPTTAVGFTVPVGAVAMNFKADGIIRFGISATLDGAAGQGYCSAAANTWVQHPVSNVATVYIRAESGTVTVEFFFQMLS